MSARFLLGRSSKKCLQSPAYSLRSASTSAPKKTVEITAPAPSAVEQPNETYLSAEDDRLPDGRRYILWKGHKYPFPWRGEVEENFSPSLINKWVAEGKWNPIRNQPKMFLPNTAEKIKIWQMYYAIRMKQGLPVYRIGAWDHNINIFAMIIVPLICIGGSIYNMWLLMAPPEIQERYKHRFQTGNAWYYGDKDEKHE